MCHSVNVGLCGVIFITFVSSIWAECGGKTVVHNVLNGTIALENDGPTYSTNTHCEWLIEGNYPKIFFLSTVYNGSLLSCM